jgi:hypothetical protein
VTNNIARSIFDAIATSEFPSPHFMDIFESTTSYENWMRQRISVVESHLLQKHAAMRKDRFTFLKGTFYRWIQLWAEHIPRAIKNAPKTLAVGDLHVDSFGTWRDLEGRLIWGIDDFDEAWPLPYTNDLVRLAASVKLAIDSNLLHLRLRDACDYLAEGYRKGLRNGGSPITLAEREQHLERLGVDAIKPVDHFWRKLNVLPIARPGPPRDARHALELSLPHPLEYKVVRRVAGTGSLGRPRFLAIGEWKGALIAREAKAVLPSACAWLDGRSSRHAYVEEILEVAVRAHDPFQRVGNGWLIRRLSPDSNPIEIFNWPKKRDEMILLGSMGRELANVHVGSKLRVPAILAHLAKQDSCWLRSAAKMMARALEADWHKFRN